ncbi:phage virion morphogenesis protein, partial [Vibrio scophthalmi]
MSGALHVEGLDDTLNRLNRMMDNVAAIDTEQMMLKVSGLMESQTRNRIANEKTSPDGVPWPVWSQGYAKGREGGHALLEASGLLLDSLSNYATKTEAVTGSNRDYASVHQDGFDGVVKVDAHTRMMKEAFGKVLDTPVAVKVAAHNRKMAMPQRQYLGI